ncbi:MAG TPA: YhjD/YihY/BrkB family envelope integrity protein [Gammaproteobacteria bacterium]
MEWLDRRVRRWLWDDPRFAGGAPWWVELARLAYALLRDLAAGELSLRAMSLVYTTMLAVVPLLAFSFSVLKGLGFHRELEPIILRFLEPIGPEAEAVTDRVIGFVDNISGSTLAGVSIVLLVFSALSMAQKVEASFNFVWRVDRPRSIARRFSEYVSVMLIGPVVMSLAMGFTAALASRAAVSRLAQAGPFGEWVASLAELLPYVLIIAAFTFLYLFVPNTRVRVVPAVMGGLVAGITWVTVGGLFTRFVVAASRYETIYSGFAIVIVAMLWLYLSWLILLFGAQLTFYLQNPEYQRLGRRTGPLTNGLRERLALATMLLVGRDFEEPGHGWREESLAARLRIPQHYLQQVVRALAEAGLISHTEHRRLVPARDPRRIPVAAILDAVRAPERGAYGAVDHGWTEAVQTLADRIDRAVRDAVGPQSLADLLDAERAPEAATPERRRAS